MDKPIYGTVVDGVHWDTSKTLRGAKIYATKNGYKNVSKRIGYNVIIIAEKVGGVWTPYIVTELN